MMAAGRAGPAQVGSFRPRIIPDHMALGHKAVESWPEGLAAVQALAGRKLLHCR